MARKLDPAFVKAQFALAGYEMLGEYVNKDALIPFRCPRGHEHRMSFHNFRKGNRCGFCSGRYVNSKDVKRAFALNGYKLLSEYEISTKKLEFICANNHRHSILWSAFEQGQRCGVCAGLYVDADYVRAEFLNHGYVLKGEYKKAISPIPCECPLGHSINISWNNFQRGKRCAFCSRKKVLPDSVKKYIELEGYTLKSEYKNAKQKLSLVCPKGHCISIGWAPFQGGDRCGICFQESKAYYYISNPPRSRVTSSIKIYLKRLDLPGTWSDYHAPSLVSSIGASVASIYKTTPSGFSVDHIVPVSYFDLTKDEELKACWDINNLRHLPIWENIKRSNNMTKKEIEFMKTRYPEIFYAASRNPHITS